MSRRENEDAVSREQLSRALAGLEQVLPRLREDARAYAALAAAIAFVEVVLERRLPGPPGEPPPGGGR